MTHDPELEALTEAVQWPGADPRLAVILANRLTARHAYDEGRELFAHLAKSFPEEALFASLSGYFQTKPGGDLAQGLAMLDDGAARGLGLPQYLRGLVLAELPGRAEGAIADLEFVLAVRENFPPGLLRPVRHALAAAYAAAGRVEDARTAREAAGRLPEGAPILITDWWTTADAGARFTPPQLVEKVPGVYVAHGFDFADFAFVVTGTGVVAVDAGSTPRQVETALAELRAFTDLPVTHLILTHSHWDHVGGVSALPGAQVIAHARFPEELAHQDAVAVPWARFRPAGERPQLDVVPDRLVDRRQTITVGGVDFDLVPIPGGETDDALVVHVPSAGVTFVGDMLMPYVGAPFFAEGSPAGLLEAMRMVRELRPEVLVHGHTGLTNAYPIERFETLERALRELHQDVMSGIRDGLTLAELLERHHLPGVLREDSESVVPYLVLLENFVKRIHRQSTGYWQPDGEGMETIAPAAWARALDLVGGGRAGALSAAAEELLAAGDEALALKVADLGLLRHRDDAALASVRQRALYRLIERYQQLNPFKFIVYTELAGLEVPAPQ